MTWFTWRSSSAKDSDVDDILGQSILWFLVVTCMAASSSFLGYSIAKIKSGNESDSSSSSGPSSTGGFNDDPDFWNILGNVFLTCLNVYCTLVPVLRDRRHGRGDIKVRHVVFYGSVTVVMIASILTPVLYTQLPSQNAKVAVSVLNVVAGTFQATVAAQLAGGITHGLLELRKRRGG
jgi:hypothetical protein